MGYCVLTVVIGKRREGTWKILDEQSGEATLAPQQQGGPRKISRQ